MSIESWGDAALEKDMAETLSFLEREAAAAHPYVGPEISRAMASGGKGLRPILLLLSCRLGPLEVPDRCSLAASVEMLHLATLIHDDVIDDSPRRRGTPALHRMVGGARAVLAGDWLLARSLSIAGEHYSPPLFRFLADRVEELCSAEILQDAAAGELSLDRRTYDRRIEGKTAALFRLACRAGAVVSGASPDVLDILDRWALETGRAFQMADDIQDFMEGDSKKGGITADLRSGMPTLPLVLAHETGDAVLARLCAHPRRRRRIHMRVIALGGVEAAEKEVRGAYERAKRLAEPLPGEGPKEFGFVIDKLLHIMNKDRV